ncbi:spherulation-specific family 4 protein [Streptomyces pinistramenti]|uniref:spherulation-specific family 4 protein n=1 Tax=Streptomyces pinistramenti TaxID=2884812 RepID=UPI001D068C4E|nr:spherulation-specific family 4 protein [Streptomyces pinistramenti]MCB5912206.1 spherulation-specific family 4 protein [Streptomyces pinistramenti]
MPYLTTVGTTRAPAGAGPLGVGVPGIAHPLVAPTEWAGLLRISRGFVAPQDPYRQDGPVSNYAGVAPLHWAVLNVANGPGARPDPYCLPAAARLRETGVRLLGHLDMRYGARPFGELLADAHRYLEWYKADGFWLDRCPTDRTMLTESRRVATTLRTLVSDSYLVFGHGTHPFPGYAESADQLVTFAGPWTEYRWSQVAEWTADHPPERFCHLVHGVPRTHLDEALRIARWQGAGTVYFTDRRDRDGDAWETLPGYWDDFVSRIGPGVLE